MSILRSSRCFCHPHFKAGSNPLSNRAFTSSPLRRLKEDHKDPSAHELERSKQEQLKKQKEDKGEWHEELASAGESNVKADRQQVDDHDKHMQELQQHGKDKAEKGKI